MERILSDTRDIYPIFWENYFNSMDNHYLEIELTNKFSNLSESLSITDIDIKKELSKLFDLLLYLTSSIEIIYLNDCNSYMDILNTLCIHSSLCRELNYILINEFKTKQNELHTLNEIINEFIDITTILTDSLETESTKEPDVLFKHKVEESKNRAKNLYLKIITNI